MMYIHKNMNTFNISFDLSFVISQFMAFDILYCIFITNLKQSLKNICNVYQNKTNKQRDKLFTDYYNFLMYLSTLQLCIG